MRNLRTEMQSSEYIHNMLVKQDKLRRKALNIQKPLPLLPISIMPPLKKEMIGGSGFPQLTKMPRREMVQFLPVSQTYGSNAMSAQPTTLYTKGFPSHYDGGRSYSARLASRARKAFGDIGHALEPVAQQVGQELVKNAVPIATTALMAAGQPKRKGGRRKKQENIEGGKGFWSNVKKGIGSVGHALAPVAQQVAKEVTNQAIKQAVPMAMNAMSGAGKPKGKRHEIVKKVMKEKGLSLIEASKYVKQHGLY